MVLKSYRTFVHEIILNYHSPPGRGLLPGPLDPPTEVDPSHSLCGSGSAQRYSLLCCQSHTGESCLSRSISSSSGTSPAANSFVISAPTPSSSQKERIPLWCWGRNYFYALVFSQISGLSFSEGLTKVLKIQRQG